MRTKEQALGRAEVTERILRGVEDMTHQMAASHAPEFVETSMTMSQAKAMYLVAASDRLGLSELAARLGVSASTASEVVDRLVDGGLVARADDPDDRRQVVLTCTSAGAQTLDRMRELNSHQMRILLERIDDADLITVERAVRIITAAATVVAATSAQNRKGP